MPTTKVGEALEKVIWEVHQMQKIVEMGAPSEDRLLDKIDHLVKILPTLREAAADAEDADEDGSNTTIPVDVMRYVDEGRNPARFVSDNLVAVGEVNKTTMGKANVFRKFHEELVKEDEKQPEGALEPAVGP